MTDNDMIERVARAIEQSMRDEMTIRHICYMDGIDWQHHLEADANGTSLFPSIKSLKECIPHIDSGGCGVVEVEVRLIRWVEPQNLKFHDEKEQQS